MRHDTCDPYFLNCNRFKYLKSKYPKSAKKRRVVKKWENRHQNLCIKRVKELMKRGIITYPCDNTIQAIPVISILGVGA